MSTQSSDLTGADGQRLSDDLAIHNQAERIRTLKKPLLIRGSCEPAGRASPRSPRQNVA